MLSPIVNYRFHPILVSSRRKTPVYADLRYLRQSADDTVALLKLELEIRLKELLEDLHYVSLERIFIEERIYKDKQFEESETMELVIAHVHRRLQPFLPELYREVTDDDVKNCWRSR